MHLPVAVHVILYGDSRMTMMTTKYVDCRIQMYKSNSYQGNKFSKHDERYEKTFSSLT